MLHAHDLDRVADAAVQAVSELVACGFQFTPGRNLHLYLRCREEALKIVLWDQHPEHLNPGMATVCEERRRHTLRFLGTVSAACRGTWGCHPAPSPHQGIKMWSLLPCAGAAAYAASRVGDR